MPASYADRAHDRELQELQGHRTATHRRILSYFARLVHAVNQSVFDNLPRNYQLPEFISKFQTILLFKDT